MFSGCIPTLVTPFHQQRIDTRQLHELIEWHIGQDCPALCIGGVTGETYSLDIEEQEKLFNMVAQSVRQRVPLIANIVDSSTRKAIWLTQAAEAAGVSAVIHRLTVHHANPIPQLLQHCHFTQQNTELPIFVECDVKELSELDICQLASIPQVRGIIDTGQNMILLDKLLEEIGPHFSIYCGNDMNIMAHLIGGTQAYFSGLANIFPKQMQALINTGMVGQFNQAKALYQDLASLYQALLEASVPTGLKYLLSVMKLCQGEVRLPLTLVSDRQGKLIQKLYNTARETCNAWSATMSYSKS